MKFARLWISKIHEIPTEKITKVLGILQELEDSKTLTEPERYMLPFIKEELVRRKKNESSRS
jgi:hypothetical protein